MAGGERATAGLDAIARDLASGQISRRTALKRFAGASLGAMLPGALFAEGALARCPESRRCKGKCCPSHAHCVHGKCKCRKPFSKCGKHCRDLHTDPKNCGSCGHKCPAGKVCENGHCKTPAECSSADECPQPPNLECASATCAGGLCGTSFANNGDLCAGGTCDGIGNCVPYTCGNGVADPGEVCDGNDLGGQTCQGLGFASGTLACANDCQSFDVSGCEGACSPGAQQTCGSNVGACQAGLQTCGQDHMWGPCVGEIGPQTEICNGIDDDCDGSVDNGFDLGSACECSPGVPGVTVCASNGLGVVCHCA
jgi:hypothetical protein